MIKELLKEKGIRIIYRPLDCKGRGFMNLNLIVLDPNLSKEEEEQVILHELGHIINQHYINPLNSPHALYKMEAEAEKHRIEHNLKSYITNTPEEYWNTFKFLDYFGIESHFESYVEEQLKNNLKK